MKQSKKLSMSGKLFRLDSPAKSVKPTTPTAQRINGEGEHNCGWRQRAHVGALSKISRELPFSVARIADEM
jgi:hypothetical protein